MGQKLEDRWHMHTHTTSHTFNTPKGTEIYCATQMAIAAAHDAHGRVRAHTHRHTVNITKQMSSKALLVMLILFIFVLYKELIISLNDS